VQFILAKLGEFPWEARVIRADGNQIYLNAGEESGVAPGTTFGLFRPGEALIDPASGLDLGTPEERVGILRVTKVTAKYSVAELIDGQTVERNDVARPLEVTPDQ
jgi:hypothetical protein